MGKTVMVLGSGGREHALVWKISQSPQVDRIFSIPGNAGIEEEYKTSCVSMDLNDLETLKNFAVKNSVDLTIVGPEAPLVGGIVDVFEQYGLKIVGPCKNAARLEGSKIFAKNFMKKLGIPTANFMIFAPLEIKQAVDYAYNHLPCAVKVDKLAAGKGVIIARSEDEALSAIERIFLKKEFGESDIVIEECLRGEEASYMLFCDGRHLAPMPITQDHKPIFDDDLGPNTGGMGAYAPAAIINEELEKIIFKQIVERMYWGFLREMIYYRGIIYIGLMITRGGPKVLEFNCRFGDPECQPLMMLLKTDIFDVLNNILCGAMEFQKIEWSAGACVTVVMASNGYPGKYIAGFDIHGLEKVKKLSNVKIFHSGTRRVGGKIVTSGGRVLSVTARADTIEQAKKRAYDAVSKISWDNEYHRADIAEKAARHLSKRM